MTPETQAIVPEQTHGREWTGQPEAVVRTDSETDADDLIEGFVDTIVRDLFGLGLQMHSIRARVDPDVRVQVDEMTDDLDHLIATVRRTFLEILSNRLNLGQTES